MGLNMPESLGCGDRGKQSSPILVGQLSFVRVSVAALQHLCWLESHQQERSAELVLRFWIFGSEMEHSIIFAVRLAN